LLEGIGSLLFSPFLTLVTVGSRSHFSVFVLLLIMTTGIIHSTAADISLKDREE
jgi:hypothetical protein